MAIKDRKGMTLTEVLFSSMIILLCAIGVILIFAQTIDMSKRADYSYKAVNFAKARIEKAQIIINAGSFDSVSSLAETDTRLGSDGLPDQEGDFKRTTVVTSIDADRTQIQVAVSYRYKSVWKSTYGTTLYTLLTGVK